LVDEPTNRREIDDSIEEHFLPARLPGVEIVAEIAAPPQARGKLIVAAVDNQNLGPALEIRERTALRLERIARPGQDVEPNRPRGNRLLELPRHDLADGQPLLKWNPFGARLSQYRNINRVVVGNVGKLRRQLGIFQACGQAPG